MEMADYAQKEADRVIRRLPVMMPGDVRFAFVPDLHYKSNEEMKVTVKNLVGAVNKISGAGSIEFLCLGGDNVGNYPPSREDHLAMMRDLAERLSFCEVPWLCLKGNHDDNSIHGAIEGSHTCRSGTEVPDDIQYEILFSHAEKYSNYHPAGKGLLYGYWDAEPSNTRFVFLNSSDIPYITEPDGTLRYNGQWDNAYGGVQLSWLCGTVLSHAPKHVIFLEHIPFDDIRHAESVRIGGDALDRITRAFVRGETLCLSSDTPDFSYRIQADFRNGSHFIPARIAGHCHCDTVTYDKAGFLSITTMSAGRKISGIAPDDAGILYEREPYSASETAMDIFTFSPLRQMIFATRYGSGVDRKFPLLYG